jgi:type IV pilus assembly protein PilA
MHTRTSQTSTARGFTLIELLIVISIMAILAMMAIPSFQDKFAREQVIEALPLADIAKPVSATSWALTKTFPADNAAAGLPVADKVVSNLVSSVTVEAGAIHMTFGNRANALLKGKVLTLRPAVIEDAPIVPIAWVCAAASAPDKMTLHGTNKTTVPVNYLPMKCRG